MFDPITIMDHETSEIFVCRSHLNTQTWYCHSVNAHDMRDLQHTGGLRAVKAYALQTYGGHAWRRLDRDTYQMVFNTETEIEIGEHRV